MTPKQEDRLLAMLEREELFDLVRRERFARDQEHWDIMADCFHPDAHIRTSWYDGNGVDYIPATKKLMEKSPGGKHWIFPGLARINSSRALVESPGVIMNRVTIGGVELEYQAFCRYQNRAERRDDVWRLLTFEVIFERDTVRPCDPGKRLPFAWEELERFRPSYRFLAYLQESRGFTPSHELLGDDRPNELRAFHETELRWLREAA